VETTEDGKVTGVEEALKKLTKDRPYLLKAPGPNPPQTDAARRGPATSGTTNSDIVARKRAEYQPL
jgi:hypothetical protein